MKTLLFNYSDLNSLFFFFFLIPLETNECLLNQSHFFHTHTKKATLISIYLEKEKITTPKETYRDQRENKEENYSNWFASQRIYWERPRSSMAFLSNPIKSCVPHLLENNDFKEGKQLTMTSFLTGSSSPLLYLHISTYELALTHSPRLLLPGAGEDNFCPAKLRCSVERK